MTRLSAVLAALLLTGPAFADGHASGDAEAGAKQFGKCKSCHMIKSDDGEVIAKGGRTGPNLWGVYGRQPGTSEGFKYGKDLVAAGELIAEGWSEAEFIQWVADPRGWVRQKLEDPKAKARMTFRLKDAQAAADVWAYLVSVGPTPGGS